MTWSIYKIAHYCFSEQQVDSWRRTDGPKVMWSDRRCCWRLSKNVTSANLPATKLYWLGRSGIIFQMLKSNCKWVEVPNWRQLKLGPCCSQFITPCIKIMEKIILIHVFCLQNYVKTLKLLNQKHHLYVIVLCLINLSNNTIFVVKTSKS